MPRDLWTWRVDVEVADLSTGEQLARVGLVVPRPRRRTWPPYQHIGETLAGEGRHGLVTLSAARPERRVLCLFRRTADTVAGATPSHHHGASPSLRLPRPG